jgi:hypothetical protein
MMKQQKKSVTASMLDARIDQYVPDRTAGDFEVPFWGNKGPNHSAAAAVAIATG